MLVKTYGSAVFGIHAATITLECDVTKGVRFLLVGLADNAVKESQQRIESSLRVNGYHWPKQKIVVNMAPADLRKEGSAYDLPMAIGILAASEQLKTHKLERFVLMGELSLDGSLQAARGPCPWPLTPGRRDLRD